MVSNRMKARRYKRLLGNVASLVRHHSPMFARACVAYRLGLVCGRCPPNTPRLKLVLSADLSKLLN